MTPDQSPEESQLWQQLHNAKAQRMRTKDLDKVCTLNTRIGELTQKIRKLRREREQTC